MQSVPRNTLNPNVTFPVIAGRDIPRSVSSVASGLFGGSMRPPPVHFPAVQPVTPLNPGPARVLRSGLTASLLQAASNATASSPDTTLQCLCSCNICVLPSCVEGSFVAHRFQARAFAKRVPLRPRPGTPCDFERCTPVWSPCSTTRATVSCHDPRRPRSAATAHQTAGCAARRTRSLDALRFAHIPEEIRACPACGTCRATHWPVVHSIAVGALERGLTLIRGSRGGFMRRVAGVIASAVVVLLVLPSRLAAQGGIIWGRG